MEENEHLWQIFEENHYHLYKSLKFFALLVCDITVDLLLKVNACKTENLEEEGLLHQKVTFDIFPVTI